MSVEDLLGVCPKCIAEKGSHTISVFTTSHCLEGVACLKAGLLDQSTVKSDDMKYRCHCQNRMNTEHFGSIKEEWTEDHLMDETHEEDPVSRIKEEPIDCEVFIKTDPDFQSELAENSELAYGETYPAEAQNTLPIKLENPPVPEPNQIESSLTLDQTAENPYCCHLCYYTSTDIGEVKRHMKQHARKTKVPGKVKERLYNCELCGYKFAEFAGLKRHLMTHTGEKPLACDLCDFRTSHSNDLQRHVMVHTGEKPFACDVCNYKSSDVRNLKRHQRTHTGEKPYACDFCRYRSRTSHHMSRHKKAKHKTKT